MFGLSSWTTGDPLTTEMEAINAACRSDGPAIDQALQGLTATELRDLAANAQFLADCCLMAARARS